MSDNRWHLENDWYTAGIPDNVVCGSDVYIDSSYAFAHCRSELKPAVTLGRGCGVYDRASFVVGPQGRVTVGSFSCLNGVYLIADQRVDVGAHCLLAWGSVVTDTWLDRNVSLFSRQQAIRRVGDSQQRRLPVACQSRPVRIEDNVWVGFDSIVLPGTSLGQGCIVGCKSVVDRDVPPYAVYVGNPGRVVRYLAADDTPQMRELAFREHLRE